MTEPNMAPMKAFSVGLIWSKSSIKRMLTTQVMQKASMQRSKMWEHARLLQD